MEPQRLARETKIDSDHECSHFLSPGPVPFLLSPLAFHSNGVFTRDHISEIDHPEILLYCRIENSPAKESRKMQLTFFTKWRKERKGREIRAYILDRSSDISRPKAWRAPEKESLFNVSTPGKPHHHIIPRIVLTSPDGFESELYRHGHRQPGLPERCFYKVRGAYLGSRQDLTLPTELEGRPATSEPKNTQRVLRRSASLVRKLTVSTSLRDLASWGDDTMDILKRRWSEDDLNRRDSGCDILLRDEKEMRWPQFQLSDEEEESDTETEINLATEKPCLDIKTVSSHKAEATIFKSTILPFSPFKAIIPGKTRNSIFTESFDKPPITPLSADWEIDPLVGHHSLVAAEHQRQSWASGHDLFHDFSVRPPVITDQVLKRPEEQNDDEPWFCGRVCHQCRVQ
jgi:hypothetical protein